MELSAGMGCHPPTPYVMQACWAEATLPACIGKRNAAPLLSCCKQLPAVPCVASSLGVLSQVVQSVDLLRMASEPLVITLRQCTGRIASFHPQ